MRHHHLLVFGSAMGKSKKSRWIDEYYDEYKPILDDIMNLRWDVAKKALKKKGETPRAALHRAELSVCAVFLIESPEATKESQTLTPSIDNTDCSKKQSICVTNTSNSFPRVPFLRRFPRFTPISHI